MQTKLVLEHGIDDDYVVVPNGPPKIYWPRLCGHALRAYFPQVKPRHSHIEIEVSDLPFADDVLDDDGLRFHVIRAVDEHAWDFKLMFHMEFVPLLYSAKEYIHENFVVRHPHEDFDLWVRIKPKTWEKKEDACGNTTNTQR